MEQRGGRCGARSAQEGGGRQGTVGGCGCSTSAPPAALRRATRRRGVGAGRARGAGKPKICASKRRCQGGSAAVPLQLGAPDVWTCRGLAIPPPAPTRVSNQRGRGTTWGPGRQRAGGGRGGGAGSQRQGGRPPHTDTATTTTTKLLLSARTPMERGRWRRWSGMSSCRPVPVPAAHPCHRAHTHMQSLKTPGEQGGGGGRGGSTRRSGAARCGRA